MRTVNPTRDTQRKPRKALKKPKNIPSIQHTPSLGRTNAPEPTKGLSPFQAARNAALKNLYFVLSPEITIPVLDETPIAVPAPALKTGHENITKVLPETAFRGTVDTGQAAPDKDLRETPAGTIEPRMSRLRTLRAAQREVGRRAKKKAKPRAPRINHQRIGKTSMSMWLVPELLDRIDRVADKLGLTRQDFLTLALERIATCYEQDSAKTIEASTAVIEQTRQLERALHQFTTTLATSPK